MTDLRTPSGGLNSIQDLVTISDNYRAEKDVLGIVEWIRNYGDYYGQLDVAYLDPDRVDSPFDAPYIIIEWRNGVAHHVFSVWELNESVKQRVLAADLKYVDVEAEMEKHNAKVRKEIAQKGRESFAEARDIIEHAAANPKTSYSFANTEGEIVTVDSHNGVVKRDGQTVESQ